MLLTKLEKYGVKDNALKLFKSYLNSNCKGRFCFFGAAYYIYMYPIGVSSGTVTKIFSVYEYFSVMPMTLNRQPVC